LPARYAADWIKKHSTQTLNWQSVSGSVFDVSIYGLEIGTGSGRAIYLDRLDMQTSVLSLLTGRIHANMSAYSGRSVIDSKITFGIWHWAIDDLNGEVDLKELSRSIPELEILGLRGVLVLTGEDLKAAYDAPPNSGDLEIYIKGLGLAMVNYGQPLGDYQLSLDSMDEEVISGVIETVSTDSQVFMSGKVRLNGLVRTIDVRGQAWVAANAASDISEILPLLGRVANGRAQVNWSGHF
jgi:hypothetical protein